MVTADEGQSDFVLIYFCFLLYSKWWGNVVLLNRFLFCAQVMTLLQLDLMSEG